MRRKMYYRTKWSSDHKPFICRLAGKVHHPNVEIWAEMDAGSREVEYKKIDKLMYDRGSEPCSFETLAEAIAAGFVELVKELQCNRTANVSVRVKVSEGTDFWVEGVVECEMFGARPDGHGESDRTSRAENTEG